MSKVFISRPDGNVAWGFRLQGGFEYNEPLTLTNVRVFLFWELMLLLTRIHQSLEKEKQVSYK